MASVDLYNMSGSQVGTIDLSDEIFGVEVNEHVMHMAVVQYLANQRQGTKATKNRSAVRGGGIKPRPQKGTGRSRQGSIRAPQWVGGGVVFAHQPRDYSIKLNKKVKRMALKSALTTKLNDNKVIVLDDLKIDSAKTKDMVKVLKDIKVNRGLIVIDESDENIIRSARNIEGILTASVNTINTYDILKFDTLVLTKAAVEKIQEVYA